MKTITPNIEYFGEELISNIFRNYHFHKIGKIISVNFSKATCDVELINKKIGKKRNAIGKSEEITYEMSPLVNCSIVLNYNSSGGLLKPINKGDECLVLFNDDSIEDWSINGLKQLVTNNRVHNLNDAIVLIGIFNQNNINIKEYNNDSVKLWYNKNDTQGSKIELTDKVNLQNEKSQIELTEKINLQTQGSINIQTQGSKIELTEKINLQNEIISLKTILNNLVTTLQSLKILDPISGLLPIDPTTITALNKNNLEINNLLK